MVKINSSKSKKLEECLIDHDFEIAQPVRKERGECCVNFIGIVMGLVLTACVLYVAIYGRALLVYRNCFNWVPSKDPKTVEYLSHHVDALKAKAYRNWVKSLNEKSGCGVDCLIWNATGDTQTIEHHQPPVVVPLKKPSKVGNQCRDIPLNLRFDCLPGDNVKPSQSLCESRGCCWKPLDEIPEREKPFPSPRIHRPTHGTPLEDLPLNVPYCFYPSDYEGYHFLNFTSNQNGYSGFLERETSSGYPHDISLLKMEVFYETDTRLRIVIYGTHRARWESPLPVAEDKKFGAVNPQYDIEVEERKGAFAVLRKSTSLPLFDTRNAAPLTYADQFLQLSTHLPSEYIYGLGEHLDGLLLDTYWKRRVLWNLDGVPKPGVNLYGSHPFYLSMEPNGNAHGVFFANSNAMEIILQPTPALTMRTIGGELELYLFLGPTPNEVISQYTELIGRPFLPPYWSLGYHQCKYGYGSLNRTKEVWQRTRDAGIPFDVQWNDLDYMEDGKDFTYDQDSFGGLPEFVEELHNIGMHYVPLVDPGISAAEPLHTYPPWDEGLALHVFVRNSSNLPFVGKVWNPVSTTWPDFTNPLATYYWGRQMLRYHDWVPFDGAWIDMNEPSNFWSGSYDGCSNNNLEHPPYLPKVHGGILYYHTVCMSAKQYVGLHYSLHNLYSYFEAVSTNAVLQIVRAKRPFIISRSSYAGLGKYSGHWTGDVHSDWFNLWQSIAGVLNFNMFGIPMVGADICGFVGNTTSSLCLRWMQLGAFYPFSRNHNSDTSFDQDPVALGEDVVVASRKALEIRYTLLPYLYSLFFRAHLTGEPVARPLFFQFYEDPFTYAIDTQFMWGSAIMICPVLEEHAVEVEAYIPKGRWYDWGTGAPVEGRGDYLTLSAPKDVIPLLVRGGTIIPTQIPANTTTDSRKNDMGLLVAPDEDGHAHGEFFWDDGDSLDTAENMNYTHLVFSSVPGIIHINVTVAGYHSPPTMGYIFILGIEANVSEVQVDGTRVSFEYDEVNKCLSVLGFTRNLLTGFSITWKF